MDQLKTSSTTLKAIEKLRVKAEQQDLDKMFLESVIEPKHEHMTRKISNLGKAAPSRAVSAPQRASSPRQHHINRAPQAAAPKKKEHMTYISAWRDAQKLVKEVLDSKDLVSQKDNKEFDKSIQKNHEHAAALTIQSHSTETTHRAAGPSRFKGRKNEGLTRQTTVPPSVNQVHEYMLRQASERRRREQKIKETEELEEEREKRSMLDVIKKQTKALTKKQQEKESELPCQKSRDLDNKGRIKDRQFSNCSRTIGQNHERSGRKKWLFDTQSKSNGSMRLADVNSWISITESQRHRVEALKKTLNSLDERVENETIRLGITKQKVTLTSSRPSCDKQTDDDKRRKDDPVSYDKHVHEKKYVISKDQPVYPSVEKHGLQSEPKTTMCASVHGDHSESTNSTSEFIWEEELRARQFSALFRLREKALMEKSQAELAWLEDCKRKTLSKDDAATEIKKKQEKVMSRLKQELAEIHHWRNVCKCGRQQRQLLLYHHRDIQDIRKTATHFRKVLEEQSKVTSTSVEAKSFITKPGITPAARNEDKPTREHRRFFSKAGLRKLLTSEEVWTFGMKRSSGEQYSAERVDLQKAGSKDQENETKKKVQSSFQTKQPSEIVDPSNSSAIHPEEQIQHSGQKTLKTKHHFPPEQRKIVNRTPTISSLSSDIEEDLPYDYEDGLEQPEEQTKAMLQTAPTDNVSLNVQNSQRSEGALLNNNHEICDESRKTHTQSYTANSRANEIELASIISRKLEEPVKDKPLTNVVQFVNTDLKGGEESPSCDDSLSEIEDKSEPFSLQSEGPICSEEEKEEEKSEFSVVYAEKFIVVSESFPYAYQIDPKVSSGGHDAAESNLSEILSPVDEILSYGSAELPSVKGGAGSGTRSNSLPPPPPPAFEIITWTSEDDLTVPLDFVEDTSINSECVPPLPVDLCLRKTDFGSLREVTHGKDDREAIIGEQNKTVPSTMTTETDQEDDASEYTSSLPVDGSNESHDPLSSFSIGDRVLVCSSRPGVLKYKGHVSFTGGFWAGVALDKPNGNHDGTFRAVKYFTCEKNHGVLVRAEDITHQHREHCSDLDTGADEDTFSDKDPNGQNGKYQNKTIENNQCRHEDGPGQNFSGSNQMFTQELCENDASKDDAFARFSRSSIFDQTSLLKDFRKKELGGFMDQWQQGYSVTSPQIHIKPHENSIVYRLVELTVEMICGQVNKGALEACDTPKYLADDKGRNTYRKVLFHLASGILHEIFAEILETRGFSRTTVDKSARSDLQTSHMSVELLKAAVRRETRKVLNLEHTDQQMTEMLQTLCKYWNAKRDRVDHILIQDLYSEEKHWVDYTSDQITVKIRMAEEIFTFLLDDTISVLNLIYVPGSK